MNKIDIKIGQRINDWTVLKEIESNQHGVKYLCECVCKRKQRAYYASNLNSKKHKPTNCGCGWSKKFPIGLKINKLTVTNIDLDHKEVQTICECGERKNIKYTCVSSVKRHKSCGCINKKIDGDQYIGKWLNFLYIESYSHTDKIGHDHYNYKCQCGKHGVISVYKLSKTKSCGCHKHKKCFYKEMSGTYWWSIKNGAKKRNLTFNLNKEQVYQKYLEQNKKCSLTGLDIVFSSNIKKYEQTASLDRIDSKKGYEISNIQWIHKDVNKMKFDLSHERLFELCEMIVNKNKLSKGG